MTNTASAAQSFSFESTLNFFFDVTSVNQVVPVATFEAILASTGGFVALVTNETLDLGTQNDSGSYELMVSGAALSDFIGAAGDTFELCCTTFTGSTMTGGGNIDTTQQTQAACYADIAYTYSADAPVAQVPEPSSLWLFVVSILGFSGLRKRKSS
ncbi:MAG: PEP-CTERM sorting domain-containing protein [Gammaproteobacteria bacterium]|nr:PEP-CTERM sorting domain-containing protein [Gammaproteobacteria bacterium]